MDRKEQEKNTLAYYNQNAKEFAAFRGEGVSQYWSEQLAHFQELLPEGDILEIGCGIGNEAIILSEMGYHYVGTDISMPMLSVGKTRLSEGNFVCQDFRSPGFSQKFDGLISLASLLHLEKDELTPTLITLRQQLRLGGVGLLALKEGVGTEIDAKGRFYSYYSAEELSQYVIESGFNLIDQTIHRAKGQSYVCCYIQNP